MRKKLLSASILAADFANLGEEVKKVLNAGVAYIHFDVMDNHYVPNLSFGPLVCSALRKAGVSAPIDVHLMVEEPEAYIESFARAGASLITFHPETVEEVEPLIDKIHAAGMGAGLVFNPNQAVEIEWPIARKLEMILLMSVFPGFGGQDFIPEVIPKIRKTSEWLKEKNLSPLLAVDGGIKVKNISQIAEAGANYFVVGSDIFSAENYELRVLELKKALEYSLKTIR